LPACTTGGRPAHATPGSSRQASRESRKSWPKKRRKSVIEAVRGERSAVINESVDLLYNLVVLWSEIGIAASEVWAEMDRRQALLGMAEKLPKEVGAGSTSSAEH
jgi:phosphoribosyl-ATP pyrophosphohydrolase